ncbi:hypothetical protein [Lysinibacillus sp. TE18511]
MLIGGFLGSYVIGTETGHFRFEVVLPIVLGAIFAFIIFMVLSRVKHKREGNVPEYDERNIVLIQKYLIVALYMILILSGIFLICLYAMGIKSIETNLLLIYLFCIYLLLGIGTLITKKI